jgi:hypothetical protein
MARRGPKSSGATRQDPHDEVPPYDDRVLAYVDILGWKDRIEESRRDHKVLRPALAALSLMLKWHDVSRRVGARLGTGHSQNAYLRQQVSQFSDLIAVSCEPSREAILHLLYVLQQFSNRLLIQGRIYTRGAVVRGPLLHKDLVILGPALVEAYQLEQARPGHPRIQVTQAVLDLVASPGLPTEIDGTAVPILRDSDGVHYLDILQEAGSTTLFWGDLLLKATRKQLKLDRERFEGEKRSSVIQKHQWMIAYLKSVLRRYSGREPTADYWRRPQARISSSHIDG